MFDVGPLFFSWFRKIFFLGFLMIFMVWVRFVPMGNVLNALPFFCFFQKVFHVQCPGCGMTHAVIALIKGQFQEAFQYHPFVGVLFVLCLVKIFRLEKYFTSFKGLNIFILMMVFIIIGWWLLTRITHLI